MGCLEKNFLLKEFLEKEPIKIKIVRRKLEGSAAILKSKQQRHCVQTILMWMTDADGEEAFTLKQLACKELISEEQHLKIAGALLEEEFNSSRLVDVIKDTKIGQGLKFLPRKLADLMKNLQIWSEELVDTGKSDVRNKVAGLLEELLRRKGISHH